ncbi:hypothetical protein GCM10007063_24970 [Lentibacillus kapialis]|uniref:Arylsulfotransferase N-terminal domain-containing protein n=1 Tax=Lentibacillus kapialis TaxID=340214 RepID=A0A917PZY2_9BACI|nr:aryl-sulfate sulfotransferase [Lentibacillus kapialis]GGK01650.1 hypothetical protein GCM10007063_24970 [Lentibacillus kapialis]
MKNKGFLLIVISILIYTAIVSGVTYMVINPGDSVAESKEDSSKEKAGNQKDFEYSRQSFDESYNWIPLDIKLEEDKDTYNLQSLTTEAKNTLDLRSLSGHDVQINGEDVSGQDSYTFTIDEISADNNLTVTVDGNNYTVRTMPEEMEGYDYENNGAEDGYYYFTYESHIVKLNTDGEIVYYKDVGKAYDFKLNKTENGDIYYSYLVQNNGQEEVDGIGYKTTKAVIMDENYNVVDEVESLIPNKEVDANPLENHELIVLDLHHYIISSYYPKEVNNIPSDIDQNKFGSRVMAPTLQEIKDGEVLWQWQSTDYPELYELSIEHNDFTNEHGNYADYVHFNSLAIDPEDNNLIISARNMSSIIKLNRDTGDIMWVLGGKADEFGLSEEQKFSRQHKLSFLSDGTILLFNNGNVLPKAPYPVVPEDSPLHDKKEETSIMKIKIDEENKEVLNYENYPTGEFSGTRGSAQMLDEANNIVLIGWGSGENNDATFTEKNLSTGEELFVFYPKDEDDISYRSYKFDQ